jgi:hypothetical protein
LLDVRKPIKEALALLRVRDEEGDVSEEGPSALLPVLRWRVWTRPI